MLHEPAVNSDDGRGSGVGRGARGEGVHVSAPTSHTRHDSFATAAPESPAARRRQAGLGSHGRLSSDFHARFPKRDATPPDPDLSGPILDFHAARERREAAEAAARSAAAAARRDQAARAEAASKLLGGPPVPAGTAGYQVYGPHATRPVVAHKVARKHAAGVRYGDAALATGHAVNGHTGGGRRGADSGDAKPQATSPAGRKHRARATLQPIAGGGGDGRKHHRAHPDAVQRALAATAPGGGLPVGKSLGDALNLVDSRAMQRYVADTRRPRRHRRTTSLDKTAVVVRSGATTSAAPPDGRDGTGAGAKLNLANPAREYNARRLERRAAAARTRREAVELSPIAAARGKTGARSGTSAAFTGVMVTVPSHMGGRSHARTLSHTHTPVMPRFEPMVASSPTNRRKRRTQRRSQANGDAKGSPVAAGGGGEAAGGASGTGGTGEAGAGQDLEVAGEDELQEEAQKARAALLVRQSVAGREWCGGGRGGGHGGAGFVRL